MKTQAFLFLISLCLAKSSADLKLQHSFFSPLDEDQKVKLYWNINMANREIFFTVEAQTTGWVGFGISSGQGKMTGADIVIGWVKDGKPYFKVKQTRSKFRMTVLINCSIHVCLSTSISFFISSRILQMSSCKRANVYIIARLPLD